MKMSDKIAYKLNYLVSLAEGSILRDHASKVEKTSEASILCNSTFTWFTSNHHITSYLQGTHQPK